MALPQTVRKRRRAEPCQKRSKDENIRAAVNAFLNIGDGKDTKNRTDQGTDQAPFDPELQRKIMWVQDGLGRPEDLRAVKDCIACGFHAIAKERLVQNMVAKEAPDLQALGYGGFVKKCCALCVRIMRGEYLIGCDRN